LPFPRSLFTAHLRAAILAELGRVGVSKHTRKGIKVEFRLSSTPKIQESRIQWKARIRGVWHEGAAGNVFDAAQDIEAKHIEQGKRRP
jgi:hypothetical protein